MVILEMKINNIILEFIDFDSIHVIIQKLNDNISEF